MQWRTVLSLSRVSGEIVPALKTIAIVSICIPRNITHVVGPSTLDGFIGAQNISIL